MEALVGRVEKLAASLRGPAAGDDAALSPTTRLAAMLKEALASNTIGGKVDEGSRVRAAQEDVRQAQASWSRIGPVPEAVRRTLTDRFQRACRVIAEAGQRGGAAGSGPGARLEQAGRRGEPAEWASEAERIRLGPSGASRRGRRPTRRLPYQLTELILISSTSNTSMPYGGLLALVGELLRDPEARFLAFDHQLHAFGPAGNDAVERERRRLAAHDRAVEQLAVGRPA